MKCSEKKQITFCLLNPSLNVIIEVCLIGQVGMQEEVEETQNLVRVKQMR